MENNIDRYETGVAKIVNTERVVSELEKNLTELEPVLEKAREDTQKLLINL